MHDGAWSGEHGWSTDYEVAEEGVMVHVKWYSQKGRFQSAVDLENHRNGRVMR